MSYQQHTYTKVTEQRGQKRLWLQGLRLKQCGFDRGERYRVDYDIDSQTISLVLCQSGNRVVSGRKRGNRYDPIVDICNADVVRFAGSATRVRADFKYGVITFSISHLDRKRKEREQRFRDELKQGQLSEGSLCSGAGMASEALHQGLAEMGVEGVVKWCVDRSRRYLQVCEDNGTAIDERTKLFEATLEELEPELLDPVSILQASLPCTGHSPAGKAKNKLEHAESHQTDATSVFGLIRVIEQVCPSVVVSENVIPARNSATYILIKSMLELLDYVIHEVDLGPEQSGAVESRRRYWFVAVSRGLGELDLTTIPTFPRKYRRIEDLLEDVDENDKRWSENQYLKDKQVRDKAAGKGFAQRQLLTPNDTKMGTAGRGYQKRRSAEPFLTNDSGKERLFTPVELCRAHGAPESLIDDTVDGVSYEILGQGIDWNQAVGLGQVIARDLCQGQQQEQPQLSNEDHERVVESASTDQPLGEQLLMFG